MWPNGDDVERMKEGIPTKFTYGEFWFNGFRVIRLESMTIWLLEKGISL